MSILDCKDWSSNGPICKMFKNRDSFCKFTADQLVKIMIKHHAAIRLVLEYEKEHDHSILSDQDIKNVALSHPMAACIIFSIIPKRMENYMMDIALTSSWEVSYFLINGDIKSYKLDIEALRNTLKYY